MKTHRHQWQFGGGKAKCTYPGCEAEVESKLLTESDNPELIILMGREASRLWNAECARQRYEAKREKILEQQHQYHNANKGERRVYNEADKERQAEYNKQYREDHKEEIAEYNRQWNEANREKIAEYNRQFNQEHPEVRRNTVRKRRALEVGANGNFTEGEFRLLCEAFENKCIYCHQELPLVPDHAVPLSRGGSNSIENIVPACSGCNLKKHTMTYEEFTKRLTGASI